MNDRDKLIELLKKADKIASKKLIMDYDDAIADNADYLIANGVTVQEWISVKDRLPDESGEYVVLNDAAHQDVLMYSEKYKLFNACDFLEEDFALKNSIKVTHWMPLLKPPKKAEEKLKELGK